MSPAIRLNPSAGRSGGALSSCRAVWGIPLQNLSMPPGGPVGRLACLGSPSIQPGGARVPQANAQTLAPGLATRWSELDSDLNVRRPEAALGTPSYCRTRETHRTGSQRRGHRDATTTTDHAATSHPRDIAGTQRVSRQEPSNHTRTCNKLRDVYM